MKANPAFLYSDLPAPKTVADDVGFTTTAHMHNQPAVQMGASSFSLLQPSRPLKRAQPPRVTLKPVLSSFSQPQSQQLPSVVPINDDEQYDPLQPNDYMRYIADRDARRKAEQKHHAMQRQLEELEQQVSSCAHMRIQQNSVDFTSLRALA